MDIRKLPSGSYQIREMVDGVRYVRTVKKKPKKFEAIQLIQEVISEKNKPAKLTAGDAMARYIAAKEHVLSPSTIINYERYMNAYPESFRLKDMNALTMEEIQAQVDAFAIGHSGKYVRNLFGLLSATMGMFRPDFNLSAITLPKRQKKEMYIPCDEDVRRVIKEIEGTEYEVAIPLAAYGMRRGEICALTIDDVKDGYIVVNKSMVYSKDKEWVINSTNTKSEERRVYIPKALEDKIRAKGYVFRLTPTALSRKLASVLKKLGIENFSIHKLRHYYASVSHALGVPDEYIMKTGGWKTDHVMKSVYRHTMKDKEDEMRKVVVGHIGGLME